MRTSKNYDSSTRRVTILGSEHPRDYRDNKVKTSKYSVWTFLPKNLYEQFSKLANVYFLIISLMQMVPIISISGGKPVMLMPLSFVIAVSMIKDIFEDYKRHKSDKLENSKQALVWDGHDWVPQPWLDLKVGMVVKVMCDEYFPADIVLVRSSECKGVCYVETKNLDGETNLKHKVAEKYFNRQFQRLDDLSDRIRGTLICQAPNDQIYKFEGTVMMETLRRKVTLSAENLLLRGSSLRNTQWVIGFIAYAGHQTKIMMNSANVRYKMSKIERQTNKQIVIVFIVQILFCFIAALCGSLWQFELRDKAPYLAYTAVSSAWDSHFALLLLKSTGTWILIFT